MHKYVCTLSIIMLFCISPLRSQYAAYDEDLKSRFRPGVMWFYSGFKPHEPTKLRKYDRLIVDIVYNDWYGDRSMFDNNWGSIGINTQLMFDVVLTSANTMSFGWGLGWSRTNNFSSLQLERDVEEEATYLSSFSAGEEPLRYRFVANYVELPLELRFRTKGYQHFKFMIGGKIGYQINAFDQSVNRIDGNTYKTRTYNFADRNLLRYGATMRVGIRNWALFGEFFFSELFRNEASVYLLPFSCGVSISLF
jgi:hypothetical protein